MPLAYEEGSGCGYVLLLLSSLEFLDSLEVAYVYQQVYCSHLGTKELKGCKLW